MFEKEKYDKKKKIIFKVNLLIVNTILMVHLDGSVHFKFEYQWRKIS